MKINSKQQLLDKFDQLKDNKLDLSSDEDLSIAIMNLISLEEHFFFTGQKTGKNDYYKMLEQIREMRKQLLGRIIKDYEGEVWCISKHLLAASMRLMEVGTKHLTRQEYDQAEEMFDKAYDLYSLFWGLNLKMIDVSQVKKIDDDVLNRDEQSSKQSEVDSGLVENASDRNQSKIDIENSQSANTTLTATKATGVFGKTRDLVKRLVDCCIE